MFCLTHAVAGAVVGRFAGGPVESFAAGLASHAVLDMIPHYDYESTPAGVLDFLLAALSVSWFVPADAAAGGRSTAWAVLGGVLPDVEVVLTQFGLIGPADLVFPSHSGLLPHRNMGPPAGILTQAAVLGLALLSAGLS